MSIVQVVDCGTGEVTERPMTKAEVEQRDADATAWQAEQAAVVTVEEKVAALPDPSRDIAGFRSGLVDILKGGA